jgi:hypothetical protein
LEHENDGTMKPETGHEELLRLSVDIQSATQYEAWKCPQCGTELRILFQPYKRGNKQMCGLQLYCKLCKGVALFVDGSFTPPTWWKKEYE